MLKYLRLVRIFNLLIIMLSQILIRYCLILPAFKAEYFITGVFPKYLSDFNFILLLASTILIAAAGYIINDYFDIYIDHINKPGKNSIGISISKIKAKYIYFILNILGIISGFYVAIQISKPVIGLLPLFSAVSLWMYSSYYKRRLLAGNIIISFLCALSILIVGLYEPEFYRNFIYLIWFAISAFLLSMIRELIKDMEDVDGDELSQCKTAPIIFGIYKTKIIVAIIIAALAVYISFILYRYFYINNVINFWYLLSMFLVPIAALIYLLVTATEKKDFHYASLYSKLLMLGGIFSILLFWFYFLK